MVWARLRMAGFIVNRKAVQRLMQIKGWQCHRRVKKRCSPRVEVSASVCRLSNVRWATDATYIWTRWDGLVYLNAVLDCGDRECIGFNVSQRNDAKEAAWALEDALLRRFGALPATDTGVILRTDNALVYASELCRSLARSYGLHQEFILPHTPGAERRRRIVHGNTQTRVRLAASLRNVHRGQDNHYDVDSALQRDPTPLTPWLSHSDRLARAAAPNNSLECPETAGSLQTIAAAVVGSTPRESIVVAAVWRASCSGVVDKPALRARRAKPFVAAIGVSRSPRASVKTAPEWRYTQPTFARSTSWRAHCISSASIAIRDSDNTQTRPDLVPLTVMEFLTWEID